MTKHLVQLPFSYEVTVLPVKKTGGKVRTQVRDYTDVLIEEVPAAHAPVAVRYESEYGPIEYRIWKKTLVEMAIDRQSELPMSPDEFVLAVSDRVMASEQIGPRDRFFDPARFPTRATSGGLARPSPLFFMTWTPLAFRERWKKRRTKDSTHDRELGLAQEFLVGAVVSIEGAVHLETTEPVLVVLDRATQPRIVVSTEPARYPAYDVFRLDRLDEAVGWANRANRRAAPLPSLDIPIPAALAREDERELADWVVHACKLLRAPGVPDADNPRHLAGILVARVRNANRLPDAGEAEDILEALGPSIDAAEAQGTGITGSPQDDRWLDEIRARWDMSTRAGRGAGNWLSPEDTAAMQDL